MGFFKIRKILWSNCHSGELSSYSETRPGETFIECFKTITIASTRKKRFVK